ncbi:MAG: tRNA (adenosine(37)-N6)-threonylcarbamoyltransferase complex transferase subunit TsaD [Firmicutes bacterium]|nr:tRNA (adenosine(37)-N6)-threonylcarbamoyltransferase complex transferase subunit TsaD [Bacillota bacterium]
MKILAFESSCDETSAAVVEADGGKGERVILSNIVASQIDIHKRFGGVVPEVAGRAHIEAISKITHEALETAGVTLSDIDIIGVTNTPGLIGALLVGVNFAKSLAFANNLPLVPVNHLKGHVAAAYFGYSELNPPYLALVASGAHTSIMDVKSHTDFETIGFTRDDAVGEAFDKAARVLGVPYPGGAEIDRLASLGNPDAVKLPSPAISGDALEFSFSGIKTAVVNYVHNESARGGTVCREDVAASFTRTVCRAITEKLAAALDLTGRDKLVIAGGVAANSHLRAAVSEMCAGRRVEFYVPDVKLCGDNAAMVGIQAYYEYMAGSTADTALNAVATGD